MNHGTSVAKIVKHMITFLKNDEELPKAFLKALKKVRLRNSDEACFSIFHSFVILFSYIINVLFLNFTRPTNGM